MIGRIIDWVARWPAIERRVLENYVAVIDAEKGPAVFFGEVGHLVNLTKFYGCEGIPVCHGLKVKVYRREATRSERDDGQA